MIHYSGPPFKVELLIDQSVLVADGRTIPVIAVRLTDEDGKPAREGAVGEFDVDPPYQPRLDESVRELRRQAGLRPESPSYQIGPNGVARIELEPTTASGKATMRFALAGAHQKELHPWLEAQARDWILVGLTGGTLGYADVTDHMEELAPGEPEDGFGFDRGTSFFAKGRVKGEWLLTASYDSQRDASEADDQFRRALEGGIDPNQYYTLYGDASETRVETPSQRPLYLKLERKQFFALFGDYTTGLTTTELSRYTRSLNGLHSEYEGENFAYSAFGTDTNQAFVKDEIRGDGTSGLYQLSRRSIVVNSEKVRVETRNRFHSEDILSTAPQGRYADYNIDYQNGTIFFKQPIPSHGDGFNPVFIVVEYEADDDHDQQLSGGGRGALKLFDDQFELGATGAPRGHDRPHLEPVRRRPAHRPRRQHAAARRVRADAVDAPRPQLGRQGHRLAGRADPPRRRARLARATTASSAPASGSASSPRARRPRASSAPTRATRSTTTGGSPARPSTRATSPRPRGARCSRAG